MATQNQLRLSSELGDGARQTKFDALIVIGTEFQSMERTFATLASVQSFPSIRIEPVQMRFKGRNIPIRGDVTYENTWSCTFYLSEDHQLRSFLEDWMQSQQSQFHSQSTSKRNLKALKKSGFYKSIFIAQRNFQDTQTTVTYELKNAFPRNINSIDLDYSSVGTVLRLNCEFSYSHYERITHDDKETQALVDQLLDKARGAVNKQIKSVKGVVDDAQDSLVQKIKGIGKKPKLGSTSSSGSQSGQQAQASPQAKTDLDKQQQRTE